MHLVENGFDFGAWFHQFVTRHHRSDCHSFFYHVYFSNDSNSMNIYVAYFSMLLKAERHLGYGCHASIRSRPKYSPCHSSIWFPSTTTSPPPTVTPIC
jgi:hypothetical protein